MKSKKDRLIFVTNDDGFSAAGFEAAIEVAREFGRVFAVAPATVQSGRSQAITMYEPLFLDMKRCEEGVEVYSFSGTPTDCVKLALSSLLDQRPDIVLSGINRGLNTATDIQYSGTAGAAFEGAFQGCLSIAVSEEVDSDGEVTAKYLPELLAELTEKMPGYGQIYNINIPGCPLSEFRGILRDRAVSHGMFYRDRYKKVTDLPGGGMRFEVDGVYNEECEPGTDFRAVVENYISVGIVNNLS
jgi:5'-nucleotidase